MKENTEKAIKEKDITRTITWWEGGKITANYEKSTFEETPFIVFDELGKLMDNINTAEEILKLCLAYARAELSIKVKLYGEENLECFDKNLYDQLKKLDDDGLDVSFFKHVVHLEPNYIGVKYMSMVEEV